MDKTTHEVRLNRWRQIIDQCQSRPEGQTAKQWLAENHISSKSYYYWLRKIRRQAYEQAAGEIQVPEQKAINSAVLPKEQPQIAFAEIPFQVNVGSSSESVFRPTAVIKIENASVAFSNSVSDRLLSGVIREVIRHA
ncbi:MAG: IS66 family insertion sequence element accessory protein TnpB [Lachnospiraceae bacterium]|nr:IS66 family insertion sequence element accessory protein TnpB [Lachnospiraceae bacterium]